MTKILTVGAALLSLTGLAAAQAKPAESKPAAAKPAEAAKPAAAAPAEMGPPKPGPEHKAMAVVVGNFTMTGTLKAGAMGPGSPEMPTKGKHTCKWIMGGLWADCEITDTSGTGKGAMTWIGHLHTGWDVGAKGYRTVGIDNFGNSFVMHGKLEGTKYVEETPQPVNMMGHPTKLRITMDFTDPKAVKFTDERSVAGGPWTVAEESIMKPAGK